MLLQIGSTGEEVKKLQIRLGVSNTGNFGPITDGKVKEWQSRNNLTANGIVDDLIWSMLFPAPGLNGGAVTSGSFKLDNLRGKIPDAVLSQLPETITRFNISNVLRLSHFLAQCGHESAGFKDVEEKLSYSAQRLKEVFPKIFTGNLGELYARNPAKTASKAYANIIGNGDEASGDGYRFRGRGFIQLTGRANYRDFSKYIGEDMEVSPDLVATKYPLSSAAFYFSSRKIWVVCDQGSSKEVIASVTRKVNAKLLGLQDRINHFNEYYALLR
ncbi:MAG: peptidoglycan-binding protein [Lentimicrobium sp.]